MKRKLAVADRIGIVSGDRDKLAAAKGERLSYRTSLLINLAASAALYGLAYLALKASFHVFTRLFGG